MKRQTNATDLPTRPVDGCTHTRARHVHGTNSAYQRCGCRCTECKGAHSRYYAQHTAGKGTEPSLVSRFTKGREPYNPAHDNSLTGPVTNHHTAMLAARTVLHHCGNPDAREVLDILGLTPILRGAR